MCAAGVEAGDVSVSDTNLIPPDIQLLTESMLWDKEISVYSGLGYKDNVLLTPNYPQGSAFSINGVDLMVIRLPADGWQIVGAVIGDDIRYWHDVGIDREDSFIGSLQIERKLPAGWAAGLEGQGLYQHQIAEIDNYGTPTNALVNGFALTVLPYLRKDLPWGLWIKAEVPITRWMLDAPLDYYWEYGPKATVGRDFGKRADVGLSYAAAYEDHEGLLTENVVGLPTLERLRIFTQKVELAWHQYWDAGRQWHSTTRLIYGRKEDNGVGYLNHDLYEAAGDLRWETSGWKIQGSAQIVYEPYSVERIAPHSPDLLCLTLLDFSLEAERRLYKGLKCYAKVEYQRSISNEALDASDYRARIVSGGLRYEF